jgi:transcription elongation factor GreA
MTTTTDSEVRLTRTGRNRLAARARHLREVVLPRYIEVIDDPDRDLQAIADFERADAELSYLCAVLKSSTPAELLPDDPDRVELGELVTIRLTDGVAESFRIVHHAEAAVHDRHVSADAPLGRALLGRRIGDHVDVAAPNGTYTCCIEAVTR